MGRMSRQSRLETVAKHGYFTSVYQMQYYMMHRSQTIEDMSTKILRKDG